MASSVPQGGGGGGGGGGAGLKIEDLSVPKSDSSGQVRGESEWAGGQPPGEPPADPQRKKTTSFKITNVFLSRPPSNDGDESAEDPDDFDDSHTEEHIQKSKTISGLILGQFTSTKGNSFLNGSAIMTVGTFQQIKKVPKKLS